MGPYISKRARKTKTGNLEIESFQSCKSHKPSFVILLHCKQTMKQNDGNWAYNRDFPLRDIHFEHPEESYTKLDNAPQIADDVRYKRQSPRRSHSRNMNPARLSSRYQAQQTHSSIGSPRSTTASEKSIASVKRAKSPPSNRARHKSDVRAL